mgnify:CR=1 FL=1
MRCLLVEDERQVMESMAEFVPWKELGFAAPLMAANGLEALKILETNRADLIVSDVRMPRMNGVELLKTLRERGDETPFLFISGFSDKEYLMAAIRYHAVDYLEKPVMAQELAERIRAVAESLRIPRRYVSVRELLRPGAKAPALLENAACYWVAVLLLAADGLRLTSQQVAGTVRAFYKWAILEEESPERTLLVFAGHGELLPFQSLVDALNRAGGGYALCLSSPVSSIEALPEAYRQADRCTQRAYMRPLRGLQRYADPSAACGALLSRTVEEIRALREKRLFPLIGSVVQRYLERLASLPEAGREEVLQGMQGIAPVRGAVIRPLLCLQRAEIEQYLREAGQSYRTDASNADLAYSRNRIRHAVVPELCRINPRALEHISRMCELLAADAAVLDRLADDVYREAEKGDALLVSALKAQPRPIRYRVLKQFLLERTGITYDQAHMHTLEALLQSGQTGSRTQLSGDIFCELRYGALYVGTSPAPAAPLEPVLVQPGASCLAGAWRISLRLEERRHADPRNALDYAKLSGPLTIRSMRSGDRFSIPGVGSKPVRRLYTDRKLPLPARGINPLLTAGERVAWIMGVGPSADCRPDNTTKQYLNIYIKEISNEG